MKDASRYRHTVHRFKVAAAKQMPSVRFNIKPPIASGCDRKVGDLHGHK